MGDLNLNDLRWDLQPHLKNSYDRVKDPMIKELKEKILEKGTKILSNTPTRSKNNKDEPES